MVFVIVLYNCLIEASDSFRSITKSMLHSKKQALLFIFDNSLRHQEVHYNDITVWSEIKYVHCPENAGLGVGYNYGAFFAEEKHCQWIVLLDQDTEFALDYIEKLDDALNKFPNIKLFAPILRLPDGQPFSPTRYKHKRGYQVELMPGTYSFYKYLPVNSGMAINVASFLEVGGYDPLIKLDFADFQFIERFRLKHLYFHLLDTIGIQDFSNNEKDISKLKTRFKIYCQCAKKCKKSGTLDIVAYTYSVLRHTIGLIFKTKNVSFLRIFISDYLF